MKTIAKYLLENKELVALLSSIFIGVATIITSVISAYFVYQQTKIYREQTDIQKKQKPCAADDGACLFQYDKHVFGCLSCFCRA